MKRRISPRISSLNAEEYALGMDVGGGKVLAQLYKAVNGRPAGEPVWERKPPTDKGVAGHVSQITGLILEAAENLPENGQIVSIGIGCPGRFRPDGSILPGTSPFMGQGSDQNEFNEITPLALYRDALGSQHPLAKRIFVTNDGNVMLAGFLDDIKKPSDFSPTLTDQFGEEFTKHSLKGKYVGLIGIGTGIGHAIAKCDREGNFQFVTDGHASKLRVKVDDEDWEILELLANKSPLQTIQLFPEDKTARAEDLFRLPTILSIASEERREHLDPSRHSSNAALKFAGKYMARTIALIHSGENQDVTPENGWSEEDKREAARTSVYLIGGGLAGKLAANTMIEAAAEELQKLGINTIKLVGMPEENIAARTAALMGLQAQHDTQSHPIGKAVRAK